MTSQFFNDIVLQERHLFEISDGPLKNATKVVGLSYNKIAIKKGSTYVDYGSPANRCGYMYLYAALHAKLVTKYFHRLMQDGKTLDILLSKDEIKICCVGGGPGTDFVGLCSILAQCPQFRGKVIKLTVLDLCEGWNASLDLVINGLVQGKHAAISRNFFVENRLFWKLTSVNLLEPMPEDVAAVIQEADIVSMVKFASAVVGSPDFKTVFEEITNLLKFGAILLFIDNYKDTKKHLKLKFRQSNLALSFQPICENFTQVLRHFNYPFDRYCKPLLQTCVFAVGCMQTKMNVWESRIPEHSRSDGTVFNGRNDIDYSNDQIPTHCDGYWDFRNREHVMYSNGKNSKHCEGNRIFRNREDVMYSNDQISKHCEGNWIFRNREDVMYSNDQISKHCEGNRIFRNREDVMYSNDQISKHCEGNWVFRNREHAMYSNDQISKHCEVNWVFRNEFHLDSQYNTRYSNGITDFACHNAIGNYNFFSDRWDIQNNGYVDRNYILNTRHTNIRYMPYGR